MSAFTRSAVALVGASALAAATAGAALAAPHGSGRHQVSKAPSWAAHARAQRSTSATAQAHAKIWLASRNQAGLEKLAQAVSSPDSSSYGRYLSAGQYRASYAPTTASVRAVESWAKAAGLHVDGVGSDNHFVSVSGSTDAVSSAFTADLRTFTVDGHTGTAPTSAVTVPDGIAGSVLAVTGLDTVTHWTTPDLEGDQGTPQADATTTTSPSDLGPPDGYVNSGPCSAYYGQKVDRTDPAFEGKHLPYAVCGYVPGQLRSAYGVTASRRTGKGETVAITDAFAAPTIRKDANTYAKRHGDRAFRRGQFSQSNDTDYDPTRVEECGGNGWFGEETLDVEAVHGMAPDANVRYYGAASCYDDDLLAALARIVTENKASIVSNSWGEPTYVTIDGTVYTTIDQSLVDAYESIFLQGAVQGIGFYFSSGDSGDEGESTGVVSPDWPAADPWVTAVGGTALAVNKRGQRQFETGWGTERYSLVDGTWSRDGFLYGAGGGCSDVFDKPFYQYFARTGCSMRGVPDVGLDADPTTGMLVGETQVFDAPTKFGQGTRYGEYRIGGTSLAAPLFAGIQADTQQTRRRIGFADPLLYLLGSVRGVFDDVRPEGDPGNVRVDYVNGLNGSDGTRRTVRTFDDDSSLTTARGWDDVTGVGAPTARYIKAASGRW
ncbi:S8/S53 family peptidase [Phycicoccus endophyticus]|uniref:S8/S53 family peptidase n=1 Tax=Phycicoccus endophyticus TaxID=1690220 RepID=A0A7G9R5C2_9MICO|nr:S53 family peptidase [Phycicoccus endophyticus]NHI20965.1 S8/S53 family peptidase [Phycicoccus endophyticus]QNN50797.1 S8/S53 family peptidase [Phycicoccus endophyticus]GGL40382.1 serine protease [Phycicoccus endophyticus]